MTPLLVVAVDTVRSVRRHRVLLATLFLCLGMAAVMSSSARRATRNLGHQVPQRTSREDVRRVGVERERAAMSRLVEEARSVRRQRRDDLARDREKLDEFSARVDQTSGEAAAEPEKRAHVLESVARWKEGLQKQEGSIREMHQQRVGRLRQLEAELAALDARDAQAGPDDGGHEQLMQNVQYFYVGMFTLVMSFGGGLVALGLFCTAVRSEVASHTIRMILAKPVSRGQFLLGKFAGATVLLLAYSALATATVAAFGMAQAVPISSQLFYTPWLGFCGNLMLGAVGFLLALFMPPAVAGVLAWFTSAAWFHWFPPLYAVLPSYEPFGAMGVFFGHKTSASDVLVFSLYAADVTVILLVLALYRFRRMELA